MSDSIEILALAPHPDDAEIGCGGTLLRLHDAGRTTAVADMTAGERGTRGTPETRRAEAAASAKVLGLTERINLGLPDAGLRDDEAALRAVLGVIRRLRPTLLLAPAPHDLHPDHEATGQIARRAQFSSGLAKLWPELGAAYRPKMLLTYPLHHEIDAKFCVDISDVAERKLAALKCFESQLGDGAHLARLDPFERTKARDAFYGAQVGVRAAEPFDHEGALLLDPAIWL